MVPAIMLPADRDRPGQTDADVHGFTSLCVDLDDAGSAQMAMDALEYWLGGASFITESSPGKRHGYWKLMEPERDGAAIATLRKVLALKAGGDPSFFRVSQVIRIPGTFNQKGGEVHDVRMLKCEPDNQHDLAELAERIGELRPLPYAKSAGLAALAIMESKVQVADGAEGAGGTWDLFKHSMGAGTSGRDLLGTTVRAGGLDGTTRWDGFNGVAGHYLHMIRLGDMTPEDARAACWGWMQTHMEPAWPETRFANEWAALRAKDVKEKGPVVEARPVWNVGSFLAPDGSPLWQHMEPTEGVQGAEPPTEAQQELQKSFVKTEQPPPHALARWAVDVWTMDEPPARRWLVRGLVRVGASHILASDGGVGKTFLLLDLAMKIAAPLTGGLKPDTWCGMPLVAEHVGKTAVIITAEDDKDELHIRIAALDPFKDRRTRGAGKIIVLPLLQAGGAFPLVAMGIGGTPQVSAPWAGLLAALAAIPDLGLVAIDTVASTLHGEENSSLVLQQWVSALNAVQNAMPDVATMATHHIRKQGNIAAPIQNAQDMRNAIRGSNALLGAVRMAIGIWQPEGWKETLKALGRDVKPGKIFKVAVVKANNPEAMEEERYLLRADHGGLEDGNEAVLTGLREFREAKAGTDGALRGWLLAAYERAYTAGCAFAKTDANGVFTRRAQLPPELRDCTQAWFTEATDELVGRGLLVRCGLSQRMCKPDQEGGHHKHSNVLPPQNWAEITPEIL